MGKERISVGVAGAGYIANFAHLPFLYNRSDACLKAICDTNLDRAKETAQRFHIPKVYATIEDMLSNERLKLVNVCLPPYSHMAAIAQVLGHDVNCLVEKPLTLTTADADAAIALAEKRGLKLRIAGGTQSEGFGC
jgi:predicted dehydrogenase